MLLCQAQADQPRDATTYLTARQALQEPGFEPNQLHAMYQEIVVNRPTQSELQRILSAALDELAPASTNANQLIQNIVRTFSGSDSPVLSLTCQQTLDIARREARKGGFRFAGTLHWLVGIVAGDPRLTDTVLCHWLDSEELIIAARRVLGEGTAIADSQVQLTPLVGFVVHTATERIGRLGHTLLRRAILFYLLWSVHPPYRSSAPFDVDTVHLKFALQEIKDGRQ